MIINITERMKERALEEANKREPYIKHHFDVKHFDNNTRNVVGFLGEFACCEYFGIDWEYNIRNNYYTIDSGDISGKYTIDIKTETIPMPYFEKVYNKTISDDLPYGRRLIAGKQISLLDKYDKVIFGGFARGDYDKWYIFGYLSTKYILKVYSPVEFAPFGSKYPEPAIAIHNSRLLPIENLREDLFKKT